MFIGGKFSNCTLVSVLCIFKQSQKFVSNDNFGKFTAFMQTNVSFTLGSENLLQKNQMIYGGLFRQYKQVIGPKIVGIRPYFLQDHIIPKLHVVLKRPSKFHIRLLRFRSCQDLYLVQMQLQLLFFLKFSFQCSQLKNCLKRANV